METKLIKPIIPFGTSAGVILPRGWLNGKAKIELIEEPVNIERDIILILKGKLQDIKGIYLTGSYARGEQIKNSDIDVLVISNTTNERIIKGKYDILLISEERLKEKLNTNIIPLLPLIRESKPIINNSLLSQYKKTPLTEKNLNWIIKSTNKILKINKEAINIEKKIKSNKISDATSYSLVLRLRSLYIINCLKKDKIWENKVLINKIKEITNSSQAYEGYLRVKGNQKIKKELSIKQAEKLLEYIKIENKKLEKWLKERKD